MEFRNIKSHSELVQNTDSSLKTYLLLYKSNSEISACAIKQTAEAAEGKNDMKFLKADVSEVRDIHPNYPVNSVPSLLYFEGEKMVNVIKGCNDVNYYRNVFDNIVFIAKDGEKKPQKRVTVYSTPSCSWCTTLKTYLRKNNIKFKEIDVSKDQKMAEQMVKRSGQQGVPQTDIGGQMIIGFDKNKINTQLGINA